MMTREYGKGYDEGYADGLKDAPQRKEPEQAPVVWMYQDKNTHEVKFQKHMRGFVDHGATYETPLYTTPPQRTWVGLTDIEWSDLYEAHHDKYNLPKQGSPDGMDYERAIEAKLKEKNT